MISTAHAQVPVEDRSANGYPGPANREHQTAPTRRESQALVQSLKDDFGDYSDPWAYDWSWRETD